MKLDRDQLRIMRRISRKDARYAKYLPKRRAVRSAEPCRHVGAPVRGSDAPDLTRDWHRCDHPRRVELAIAEVVCACKGCRPGCKGYQT